MQQRMNAHLLLLLGFAVCVSGVAAFAPLLAPSSTILRNRTPILCLSIMNDKDRDDDNYSALLLDSARESASFLPDLGDSSNTTVSLLDSAYRFADKFLSAGGGPDPIGTRGEAYFFVQAALVVAIALGGLPGVTPALEFLAGPGLLVLGLIVLVVTALNLGESITPWPKPNGQGLVQDGLYGVVRHPMYFGLLATMAGFSVITGSIPRLLLSGLLWFVLDVKCDYEEEELKNAYPGEYETYLENVPDKFVPIRRAAEFWKSARN